MNDRASPKHVFAVTERGDRTHWTRIGVAFVNRDSSLTLRLDALPLNGTLVVRDAKSDEPDDHPRPAAA